MKNAARIYLICAPLAIVLAIIMTGHRPALTDFIHVDLPIARDAGTMRAPHFTELVRVVEDALLATVTDHN